MRIRATLRIRNDKMISARQAFDLSQKDLDLIAQVPRGTTAFFEKLNYRYRTSLASILDHAEKIAAALGVPVVNVYPPELQDQEIDSEFVRVGDISEQALLEGRKMWAKALPGPLEVAEQHDLSKKIEEALDTLPWKQAAIIRKSFGLEGEPPMTTSELAKEFNLSRARVFQIRQTAVRKLRHPGRKKIIEAAM